MKIRYVTFFLIILSVLIFLKLVFSKGDNPHACNIVRINLQTGDPSSLHPHRSTDKNARILVKALFEGLTRIDENGLPALAAAEKMEVSPDQKRYTFTLRPHVWSNGKPVTAYHFEAAWKKALSPNEPCLGAELFYVIKNAKEAKQGRVPVEQIGVKAINADTLIVELENPNPFFTDILANPLFSPLFDAENAVQVVNGPFQMESWKHDSLLKLVKNPLYWDAKQVKLDGIHFSMVKDPDVVLCLFERGEIDWLGNPFQYLSVDALSSRIHAFKSKDIAGTYLIYINTEKIPFTSTKVRKALSYALDRKSFTDHILIGHLPHKSPIPKIFSFLEQDACYPDTCPEIALSLFEAGLRELGLTRTTCPPLVLTYSDIPGQKNLAEEVQQVWQKAFDIPISLEGCEWSIFVNQLDRGQFQMGGLIHSGLNSDPLCFLQMFKEKQNRVNRSNWENEDFKHYLDLAETKTDENERKALLKQAEKILVSEMPVIPIFSQKAMYLTSDRLDGIIMDKCGHVDFKKVFFKS